MTETGRLVLLTGGTGYVGGRLLALLLRRGVAVRCLARRPEYLEARVAGAVEVVGGDLLAPETLTAALSGCQSAYYLVRPSGAKGDEQAAASRCATNFATAAKQAGVRRIIYLSELAQGQSGLDLGGILRDSGAQVIELAASTVIGSGSLSLELARASAAWRPLMLRLRWLRALVQPIAIEDVLDYLLAALDLPEGPSLRFEIGGPEAVPYEAVVREYARQRGGRRVPLPVPLTLGRLSSLMLALTGRLNVRAVRGLIDGLRESAVVRDTAAAATFAIRPRPLAEAISRALTFEGGDCPETRWCDALSAVGPIDSRAVDRPTGRFVDRRTIHVPLAPEQAFSPIQRIGGDRGWYCAAILWWLRSLGDLLIGGVGMIRGRRDGEVLRLGDTIDGWRVVAFEPNRRLLLHAEMRMPGRGWLEFVVTGDADGSTIRQTAYLDPIGLVGPTYWYGCFLAHQYVFRGMLKNLARAALVDPPDRA